MLLDQKPTLEDLTELSPVEGRSLQALLEYQGDDFEVRMSATLVNFSSLPVFEIVSAF